MLTIRSRVAFVRLLYAPIYASSLADICNVCVCVCNNTTYHVQQYNSAIFAPAVI